MRAPALTGIRVRYCGTEGTVEGIIRVVFTKFELHLGYHAGDGNSALYALVETPDGVFHELPMDKLSRA